MEIPRLEVTSRGSSYLVQKYRCRFHDDGSVTLTPNPQWKRYKRMKSRSGEATLITETKAVPTPYVEDAPPRIIEDDRVREVIEDIGEGGG